MQTQYVLYHDDKTILDVISDLENLKNIDVGNTIVYDNMSYIIIDITKIFNVDSKKISIMVKVQQSDTCWSDEIIEYL